MTQSISRRAALASLLSACSGAVLAQSPLPTARPRPRPLPERIGAGAVPRARPDGLGQPPTVEEIVAAARLTGEYACAAFDIATGRLIESVNDDVLLPPASVMKALTAAYALDRLGADHRFATRLIATGPVVGDELQGDLVLAGGGDPTLETRDLDRLAEALAGAGVRRIGGRFLVWGGALPFVRAIDPDQGEQLGYNPAVSGLNLNYNRVHFSWERTGTAYTVSLDARSGDLMPAVTTSRMTVEDRGLPVYTYASAGGRDLWTVARRALGKGGARWLPVRNPDAYAGEVLVTLARRHGVVLPAARPVTALPAGETVAEIRSAPLREVAEGMLRYSTNLTAEALGLAATLSQGPMPDGVPPLVRSGTAMAEWGAGALGLEAARIVDHSGLGDESRLSARAMAGAILRMARGGPEVVPILKPFAMPDGRGGLGEGGPVRVAAKTGTLNFVSGLAGVARGDGGREVAFAVFTGDLAKRARGLASGDEIPDGARPWNASSKRVQRELIGRWTALAEHRSSRGG